jgi:hypothetical protein
MKKILGVSLTLALVLTGSQTAFGGHREPSPDLDAFWDELARTVAEGDFEGYAAMYHEDAILVSGLSETSYPISQALEEWKQGFVDTREGKMQASVEFRFTQRLSDETTAHLTGMFHYAVVDGAGARTEQAVHFEALLINTNGWKMMMEYQKSLASQEEWEAAG